MHAKLHKEKPSGNGYSIRMNSKYLSFENIIFNWMKYEYLWWMFNQMEEIVSKWVFSYDVVALCYEMNS